MTPLSAPTTFTEAPITGSFPSEESTNPFTVVCAIAAETTTKRLKKNQC